MHLSTTIFSLLTLGCLASGCRPEPLPDSTTQAPEVPQAATLGKHFDPERCGRIEGKVLWKGYQPKVDPIPVNWPGRPVQLQPNPNRPHIDPSGGMGEVLVHLEKVSPEYGRPWDLPPVQVEVGETSIQIHQGERKGRFGIVQVGKPIRLVNRISDFQSIRLRGAAFGNFPLVVADRPTETVMDTPGLVELSSGNGRFWQGGSIQVSDHPYGAVTDDQGRFSLDRVPEGSYRLVCRVPNWHIREVQPNPEWRIVHALTYQSPARRIQAVQVRPGGTTSCNFEFSTSDFPGVGKD